MEVEGMGTTACVEGDEQDDRYQRMMGADAGRSCNGRSCLLLSSRQIDNSDIIDRGILSDIEIQNTIIYNHHFELPWLH